MTQRNHLIVAMLWIAVAGLMAISIDPTEPTSLATIAQSFVVLMALFLAVMYLFDPFGIVDYGPDE